MNSRIKITPEKWVSNGFTIGHCNGKTVFLTGGIPDREDEFIIERETSKLIYGRAVAVDSDCEAFPECGGCSYRHITYKEELEIKKQELYKALSLSQDFSVDVISSDPNHYRNNVQWKVADSKIGFHSRYSHEVVDLQTIGCKNLNPQIQYPVSQDRVFLRVSKNQVVDYSREESMGSWFQKTFIFPPKSFQQVNSKIVDKWLSAIQSLWIEKILPFHENPSCLELFSGVGLIGQILSPNIEFLEGWEGVGSSVQYAKKNASINKIQNTNYKKLDLYRSIPNSKALEYPVWIMNPPRSGAGRNLLDLWKSFKPDFVVYSGCDVHTLGRDWKIIRDSGDEYRPESIQLLDFFPRTKHFETLILFAKSSLHKQ